MSHIYPSKSRKEMGNALILILVVIAILAALTAVMMRSSGRALGNLDIEQARIEAQNVMRASKDFEMGVQKLINANRCSEKEINFANTSGTARSYTNTYAPASKNCDLFDVEGAGLTYSDVPATALDSAASAQSDYGDWVFSGSQCVLGVGSDANNACVSSELALIVAVPFINTATCLQINNLVGVTNTSSTTPPTEDFDDATTTRFLGLFTPATDPEIGEGGGSNLVGKPTGCYTDNAGTWSGYNVFYRVISPR